MSSTATVMLARRALTQTARSGFAARSVVQPCTHFMRLYASKFIDMPALSPTMTQGNVGQWQKSVGDKLSPGEALVEIETDKATMDFEFQEEGFLAKILLDNGEKDVPVGKPIGVYVEDEADVAAFKDFTVEDAADGDHSIKQEEAPKEESSSESKKDEGSKQVSPEKSESQKSGKKSEPVGDRIFASPIAKMIALEQGIPLKDVKGSGPNGRIIKRDVENYKPSAAKSGAGASAAAPASSAAAAGASYTDTPISSMRKTIASRLTHSKQTNPDYIVSSTMSVSKLLKLRAALNESSEGRFKISVNDMLMKAIAIANKEVTQVNSAWLEKEGVIRQYNNVDVSIAVATPTGLITPVLKNVDAKGLSAISNEAKALGKKARDGKLAPEEYQGGTITISNMGMNNAVSMFTAIINPPQSTILAVGTTERRAVEDPESESGVAFDDVMTLTATFDHKVVDGAVGAEWIKALKRIIENPLELML